MEEKNEELQNDLFKAETTWFHIFRDMIDNGDMAKLEGSAIKVYLVIKSYTNFSTGRSFPPVELIAKKAGLSKMQVMRCLKSLEEYEYISKQKVGKHNVYILREKVSIKSSDGRPQAVATWDYIPNSVKDAVAELKHAVITGEMIGGRIIHIKNSVLNVSTGKSIQISINPTSLGNPNDIKERIVAMKEIFKNKS